MLEALLVRYGAPTLAGLKTGSLFSCVFPCEQEMLTCLLHWNRRLSQKGLRLLPLRQHRGRTLIYLYRPAALARDLRQTAACALLRPRGYPCPNPERCITCLCRSLRQQEDFPHEIGLFLGYPPEDVRGFLERPAEFKWARCWKVYGDVSAAQQSFAAFHACTRLYTLRLSQGTPLEHLAVSD